MFKDILAALKEWPKWKTIEACPERIDGLSRRIEALEKQLERCPGEACPRCGALAFRVVESRPDRKLALQGFNYREMECKECQFKEGTLVGPKKS